MLTVRAAQLAALQATGVERFAAEVETLLRRDHADAVERFDAAVLSQRVTRGIAIAQAHGLSQEPSVALFVTLLFIIGPGFDLHPNVQAILDKPGGPPEARLARLLQELAPETWLAAAANRDHDVWAAARATQ